jgi:hypothetical protein
MMDAKSLNAENETKLAQVLKAFVEEWGPEFVILKLPKSWEKYRTNGFGKVKSFFVTENSVIIEVDYKMGVISYELALTPEAGF